ncbi:MAG: hypothetical protein K0Q95_1735 [Bacteroidota bacterium]|jgi:hypothetical protein|nr:hypothetical protein [Bacteroidota bacterium]
MSAIKQWEQSSTKVFWGEIAPAEHLVQIYENDAVMIDSLEGFVTSGFDSGDSVVIIATDEHLQALHVRLKVQGYNLEQLINDSQYVPLNAIDTLSKFMRVGWPDEKLFMKTVTEVILKARGDKARKIRAFGEMVAILWEQGYSGATVQLENLWNKFSEKEEFCLFCAYPKSGFTQDPHTSMQHICSTHTKVIDGLRRSKTEVFYKDSTYTKA